MNRDQRIVAVVALAVALWGLSQLLVPFTVTVSGFFGSVTCSPAVVSHSAEDLDLPPDFTQAGGEDLLDSCAKAARRRLGTAGVILGASVVGGYGGFRLLRERRPAADPVDPVEADDEAGQDFSPYDPE